MVHLQIGPLRCWPGGLCLSRSIGDLDVGEYIVPVPHVKQVKVLRITLSALECAFKHPKKWKKVMHLVQLNFSSIQFSKINLLYLVYCPLKLSNAGGRLVIASDGVWDALSHENSLSCCRGLPAEAAATRIVKVLSLSKKTLPPPILSLSNLSSAKEVWLLCLMLVGFGYCRWLFLIRRCFLCTLKFEFIYFLISQEAVKVKGLRDDTTCIVVDILPPEKVSPPIKKPGKVGIKYIFRRKSSDTLSEDHIDRGCSEPDVVEEIFEDGSAMLSERCKI